ncbi:MAG TPA: hypothetical protein QF716_05495, partial [Candidatus Thalassarchaeaceae archaeon]|nr:hypothetical protein [Candidatus Thalassarchaeaceae archaeon]
IRLYVEGELDVTGTSSSPATITRSGDAVAHEGIQFNATSRGRGSVINFLTIEHAEWGITVYNSNPTLNDVYIENPDYVASISLTMPTRPFSVSPFRMVDKTCPLLQSTIDTESVYPLVRAVIR